MSVHVLETYQVPTGTRPLECRTFQTVVIKISIPARVESALYVKLEVVVTDVAVTGVLSFPIWVLHLVGNDLLIKS